MDDFYSDMEDTLDSLLDQQKKFSLKSSTLP
jgi:hypothetical protein